MALLGIDRNKPRAPSSSGGTTYSFDSAAAGQSATAPSPSSLSTRGSNSANAPRLDIFTEPKSNSDTTPRYGIFTEPKSDNRSNTERILTGGGRVGGGGVVVDGQRVAPKDSAYVTDGSPYYAPPPVGSSQPRSQPAAPVQGSTPAGTTQSPVSTQQATQQQIFETMATQPAAAAPLPPVPETEPAASVVNEMALPPEFWDRIAPAPTPVTVNMPGAQESVRSIVAASRGGAPAGFIPAYGPGVAQMGAFSGPGGYVASRAPQASPYPGVVPPPADPGFARAQPIAPMQAAAPVTYNVNQAMPDMSGGQPAPQPGPGGQPMPDPRQRQPGAGGPPIMNFYFGG